MQMNKSNREVEVLRWIRNPLLLLTVVSLSLCAGVSANAQVNANLGAITITSEQSPFTVERDKWSRGTDAIVEGSFRSNPAGVAEARTHGTDGSVQIVTKGEGTTLIVWRRYANNGEVGTVRITVHVVKPEHPSIFAPLKPPTPKPVPPAGGNAAGGAGPKDVTDKAKVGVPKKENVPGGGYKEIFKNKAGQTVEEKEYDAKGKLINTKDVDKVHPDGKPAQVTNTNAQGESEEVTYDKTGKITKMEVYKDLDKDGHATTKEVTENGKTTTYSKDKTTGKWIEKDKAEKAKNDAGDKTPKAPDDKKKGKLDKCLVGSWLSKPIKSVVTNDEGGGDGIVLVIGADGRAEINYNAMQNWVKYGGGATTESTGYAKGRISTDENACIVVDSVQESSVANKITYKEGQTKGMQKTPGFGLALSGKPYENRYTCDANSLTIRLVVAGMSIYTVSFVRSGE